MDRLLSLEAFVRVAESNSFAAAAEQLGVSRSVISNRIQQLEKHVNAPLFHRSTRHVRLSELGEAFYADCAKVVGQVNDLTDNMRERKAMLGGRLRIHMLPGYAVPHFAPLLAEFTRQYPDIQLDIVVGDRVVDPVEEGFDIAFQIFPPISEALIERRLLRVRRLFCATPAYLKRRGSPKEPADLLAHPVAVYAGYPSRNRWAFERSGTGLEMDLPGQVRTNSVHMLRDYALQHAAIVCLPTMVASASLLSGELVPVLTDYTLSSFHLAAVYPETQRQSLKVSVLVNFMSTQLQGEPEWDQSLLARGWVR